MANPNIAAPSDVRAQVLTIANLSGGFVPTTAFATALALYTVPADKAVAITGGAICNTSGAAVTVQVALVPTGTVAGSRANYRVINYTLEPGDSIPLKEYIGVTMGEGDAIFAVAGSANALTLSLAGTVLSE